MRKKLVSFTALILVGVLCMSAQPAQAQDRTAKQRAKALFQKGKVQFDLGRFSRAIEHFSNGYEAFSDPAFLFSIAQSYRQLDDCKNSIFFFKRYLSEKRNAPDRKAIKKRIREIKNNCDQRINNRDKPPTGTVIRDKPPVDTKPPGATKPPDATDNPPDNTTVQMPPDATGGTSGSVVDEMPAKPGVVVLRVGAASTFLSFTGSNDIPVTPRGHLIIGAAYPLPLGKNRLDLGVLLSMSNLPFEKLDGAIDTAALLALLGNVTFHLPVAKKIMLLGEVGAGVLIMTNLNMGNPFIKNNQAIGGGSVLMLHLRVAAGAEYILTSKLSVNVNLGMGVGPAHTDFQADIDGISRLELGGGLQYQF